MPWDTSSPEWQSVPRVLQGSQSALSLTRLIGSKAVSQRQTIGIKVQNYRIFWAGRDSKDQSPTWPCTRQSHVLERMCENTKAKRIEGQNTLPEVLCLWWGTCFNHGPSSAGLPTSCQPESSNCRPWWREEAKCAGFTCPLTGMAAIPAFYSSFTFSQMS